MASPVPAPATNPSSHRKIVIIGGGVIGCITAYYLTRHPSYNRSIHSITLVEATSIAAGASGKAGGLLALWAYPASIVPLSFQLHADLAKEHNGAERWGYRRLGVGTITAKGRIHTDADVKGINEEWKKLPKVGNGEGKEHYGVKSIPSVVPEDLDWFDQESISSWREMGTPETTAQVHPLQFTNAIAELAVAAGVKIIYGRVTALDYTGSHGIKGVTYEDKETKHIHTLPATDAILAAGPWTSHVFPDVEITALRAHSVVIEADVTPYAVFTDIELPKGWKGAKRKKIVNPEMYARPDGTVYACGDADAKIPLPKTADLVVCDDEKCDDIFEYIASISSTLRAGKVAKRQACYLPSVGDGVGPLIGNTGIRGLLMATGHTCWGIQNSAATGKLISEFVFEGRAKSAIIEALDPVNFL